MWQAPERTINKTHRYITFRVTLEAYELVTAAAKKDAKTLAAFAREATVGVADIAVNEPSFSIAPCEACGHVNGAKQEGSDEVQDPKV